MPKQLIIYCDESTESGRYYSHFYGGVLIRADQREQIEKRLVARKEELHLFKELKWVRVTANYAEKYKSFLDEFFDLVEDGAIKVRIMFTQNMYSPRNLDDYQIDNQYFLLYYQLIKHAFGLRYANPDGELQIEVALYLDDVPEKGSKFEQFKDYMSGLSEFPVFRGANIRIARENIADVDSKQHVIMQGLDVVLGAMQFRLNDLHKTIPEGARRRGKRTIAKEAVYKHINSRIQRIYPRFNIGVSTGQANGPADRWLHPYRHWLFIPADAEVTPGITKKNPKK